MQGRAGTEHLSACAPTGVATGVRTALRFAALAQLARAMPNDCVMRPDRVLRAALRALRFGRSAPLSARTRVLWLCGVSLRCDRSGPERPGHGAVTAHGRAGMVRLCLGWRAAWHGSPV